MLCLKLLHQELGVQQPRCKKRGGLCLSPGWHGAARNTVARAGSRGKGQGHGCLSTAYMCVAQDVAPRQRLVVDVEKRWVIEAGEGQQSGKPLLVLFREKGRIRKEVLRREVPDVIQVRWDTWCHRGLTKTTE